MFLSALIVVIQITPMRLHYLDQMWNAYIQKHGAPMPVDIWTMHAYVLQPNGNCSLRDEYGQCFTPPRVSQYMRASFNFFTSAYDPALGMPADNGRLVQQWISYGAYDHTRASSNLLQSDLQTLTSIGTTFKNQVAAEQHIVNLILDSVSGTAAANDDTIELSASFRNNGSKVVAEPFSVTFYSDPALTQLIGSAIIPVLSGCATQLYTAAIKPHGLPAGTSQFWVKLDALDAIAETDESDNLGAGQVSLNS